MELFNDSVEMDLGDLVTEIYAKLLVHDAQLTGMAGMFSQFIKHVIDDELLADELLKNYVAVVNKEIERLKTENSIMGKLLMEKIAKELSDVPGIRFK
jgi:hypothetical protein